MRSATDWEELVLTSSDGLELLASLGQETNLQIGLIEKYRKKFGKEFFEAGLRIQHARLKAKLKFAQVEKLWLDSVRAEQATDPIVANYKANRFAGRHVADLCCGLGSDSFALVKKATSVIALDLDRDCVRRLKFNCEQLNTASLFVVRGDAIRACVPDAFWIHVDPDRRHEDRKGRPVFELERYQPNLAELMRLVSRHPGGAIKLSPGSAFEKIEEEIRLAGYRCEVEVISLHGECKEATVWFGALAGGNKRRATILPEGESFAGSAGDLQHEAQAGLNPGDYVYEVDKALLRAGLVHELAEGMNLQGCLLDGSFLWGKQMIQSPWLSGFKVVCELKPDRKMIRQKMRESGWKTAVVKSRGSIHSNMIQAWMEEQPLGTEKRTLFVWAMSRGQSRAILAERL